MVADAMDRRGFLKAAGVGACALALAGCEGRGRGDGADRPNVLWVTCEDISPYLGCYGDEFAITPNLDALAGESVLYEKAFATAPVCAPCRSCLVTGVYATTTGTQHLRSDVKLPASMECFPQLLRAAGYYCSNNYKKDYNFKDVGLWDESSHDAHWRKRKVGQPFFSVFNFTSTHQGQINGSDELFDEKYRSKLTADERHDAAKLPLPPYYPDTPVVRDIWCRYYDLITFMDKQVGDLLGQLETDGLAEDTIVFFFSDHGMGLPRFKRTLYDSGLHVPFMVRLPEKYGYLSALAAGTRTERMVSFVDFPATVLSMLGMAVPGYMQGEVFLGADAVAPRQYVYGAASRVDEAYEVMRCVRDVRYKYIRNYLPQLAYIQPSEYPDQAEIMKELRSVAARGGLDEARGAIWASTKPREELYDTENDPDELVNLAGSADHAAVQVRLKGALRKWMIETCDTGLMMEAQMHIRSEHSTAYETAQSAEEYPIARVLDAADLVGGDEVATMIEMAGDSDAAVRYWAVLALTLVEGKDEVVGPVLVKAMDDTAPHVRFAASGALADGDACEKALAVLGAGLNARREETVLAAAREIQMIGASARPLLRKITTTRRRYIKPGGGFTNNNHAMFIAWALKSAEANCTAASLQR